VKQKRLYISTKGQRLRIKPNGRRLYDNEGPSPAYTPPWRIVTLPTDQRFIYEDLEHALNARIIARAWANAAKDYKGDKKFGWAAFARYLNYTNKARKTVNNESAGLSGAVSNRLYTNVVNGTLPKEERVRQLILELSGYPWE
jgi:hypothetical protein